MLPRQSTPHPTVPPPNDEPAVTEPLAERAVKRIKLWQALVAAALACFSVGAAAGAVRSGLATHDDLAEERKAAAVPVLTLQADNLALRDRVTRVEADLSAIKATVGGTQRGVEFLTVQLLEIAKTTGSRQLKPPPAELLAEPPIPQPP
jgi:hypothetical protein